MRFNPFNHFGNPIKFWFCFLTFSSTVVDHLPHNSYQSQFSYLLSIILFHSYFFLFLYFSTAAFFFLHHSSLIHLKEFFFFIFFSSSEKRSLSDTEQEKIIFDNYFFTLKCTFFDGKFIYLGVVIHFSSIFPQKMNFSSVFPWNFKNIRERANNGLRLL